MGKGILGISSTTYIGYVWPGSVHGHFETFGSLVSKWQVTQKRLVAEWKGLKLETRGVVVVHIWSTVDLVVCMVMLGSFSALVLNLISSNLCAKFTSGKYTHCCYQTEPQGPRTSCFLSWICFKFEVLSVQINTYFSKHLRSSFLLLDFQNPLII